MATNPLTTLALKQELVRKKGEAEASPDSLREEADSKLLDEYEALLEGAKSDLREFGIMEGDPLYRYHQSMSRLIHELSEARETVIGSVRGAVDEEVEHGRARIAAAEEASLVLVRNAAMGELARIKWRLAAGVGCVLSGLVLVSAGASYWLGWSQSRSSYRVTETSVAAAFRDGPEAAASWVVLMRNNDILRALEACQGAPVQEGGRIGCRVPLWIDGIN